MSIVASEIVEDRRQADGRRRVRERHRDHAGEDHFHTYLAGTGDDIQATMTNRVTLVEAELAASEISRNIRKAMEGSSDWTLVHSTVAQNITALRGAFRDATRWEVCCIGKAIQSRGLTDAQLRNAFNLAVGAETTAFKTRLTLLSNRFDEITAFVGQ